MKKVVVGLGVVIVILLGVLVFYNPAKGPTVPAVSTSTVQSLVSSDGHVALISLHDGDIVTSPLTITGTVTGGGWFFEATFPVKVLNAKGNIIGNGFAQAQADWMTTSSVPFTAIINFTAPHDTSGTVVLSKDNPSGMPKNDLSFSIPVGFK